MSRTRILFVLPSLHAGGAERVIVRLLTHLGRAHADLHLALIDKAGPFVGDLPADVTVHDLQAGRLARGMAPLVRLIWRLRPQAVISSISHVNVALAMAKPLLPGGTRLILRESNVCQRLLGHSKVRRWLYGRAYAHADLIICQSDFMRADLQRNLGLPTDKLVRIYNPIAVQAVARTAQRGSCALSQVPLRPHVVAIGSLQSVKGFDRLLQSMPALLRKWPGAQAWILGRGPLHGELRRQSQTLGISRHVHLPGFQANPFPWLREADLLVNCSRFDCAPNVVLEAIACRCPVVVRDHPGGTREIMERTGQAQRVVLALNEWRAEWFERPAPQTVELLRTHFDVSVIVRQYEAVLYGDYVSSVQRAAA